ncbi:hypothetical protein HJC22_28965 [Corallococcus exiguus]|uniref:hypothetical protein n=1 Tax=Corallococcus TaxID=83461 RepID=UPI000EA12225|nr:MULTISPECIES: hypothetical protein [Corallococcus]NNC19754.1 hypothetical protein [Corallococcus exiguus]RKH22914.1 hypothetical protein D7V77_25575 [Corallococcus sp. CA041A]RUO88927.1 hypothetical protein D7Y11_32955 [Corallococcus sp. AB018]
MTSRFSLAVALVLGAAGCAGVQQAPSAAPVGTVRFTTQAHFNDCDIVATARPLADAQSVDCGEARSYEDRLKMRACVEAADAAGKPFIAIFHLPGIDSAISQALLRSANGEHLQLWYDSDPSGGNGRFQSRVHRRVCERFVPDPDSEADLRCESQTVGATVCLGTEYALGALQSAAGLLCMPDETYAPGIFDCGSCEDARSPVLPGYKPVPAGTLLVCKANSPQAFTCSSTSEMDDAVGVLTEREPPPVAPKGGP